VRKMTLVVAALAAAVSLVGTSAALADDAPKQPALIDAVAAKLGLTPAQLQAAFKAVLVERIDAKVAAGALTPEQAAKLKERIANAQGLGLGARKAFGKQAKAFKQGKIAKAKKLGPVATLLKMTREELRAELKAGKSLTEVAAAKGVSKSDLVNAMTQPAKDRLAKAVAAGKLTQARADQMLQKLTERVTKLVDLKKTQTA
jgi:methylphosphotriester-DNA--protein-cysteine methyltransferase